MWLSIVCSPNPFVLIHPLLKYNLLVTYSLSHLITKLLVTLISIILKYFPNITTTQQEQFAKLQALYEEWNAQINVISRKDIDLLYERHVLHSLGIA